MNIDYEKIILKARTRREKLEEIEKQLNDVPAWADTLHEALSFFANLRELHTALDSEGRELLGEASGRIESVGYQAFASLGSFQETRCPHELAEVLFPPEGAPA